MTAIVYGALQAQRQLSIKFLVIVLFGITLVRLVGLKFSGVDLFYDEAQYWAWSRNLAFGYSSKPPLLSWIIALAEHMCGAQEPCIRAPAPIIYLGTSLVVYALAKELYDNRTAIAAALVIAFAPGTIFSARIISTDVPLMFCWAAALLAYLKLLTDARPSWGILLGFALGFGLLAKYAMVYFLFGIALACLLDRDARALLYKPSLWLSFAIAAVLVAPNLAWNVRHGFVTFTHVGENIEGDGFGFDPLRVGVFLVTQLAVVGPFVFPVIVIALTRIHSSKTPRADRLMLAFAIPPLALVTAAALATKVYGNWAAPSFISGSVVAAAFLVRRSAWRWVAASVALGAVLQAVLLFTDAFAARISFPKLLGGDIYRPTLGWQTLGATAGMLAQETQARTLAAEQRSTVAALAYYWRDKPQEVLEWPLPGSAQFDLTSGLSEAAVEPILLITNCPFPERFERFYSTVLPIARIDTVTGPTTIRAFGAVKLSGRRGPIGPLPPCKTGTFPPEFQHAVAVPKSPTDGGSR